MKGFISAVQLITFFMYVRTHMHVWVQTLESTWRSDVENCWKFPLRNWINVKGICPWRPYVQKYVNEGAYLASQRLHKV